MKIVFKKQKRLKCSVDNGKSNRKRMRIEHLLAKMKKCSVVLKQLNSDKLVKVELAQMHKRKSFLGIVQDKEVAVVQGEFDVVKDWEKLEREGVSSSEQMCAFENDQPF